LNRAWRIGWRRIQRRIGWAGIAALFLALLGVGLAAWLVDVQRDADAIHQLRVTHRPVPRPVTAMATAATVQGGVDEWVGGFPTLAQNAADLAVIFASAERNHVALTKGEYQLKTESGSPFVVYTASFPVRAPYSALKAFAADVLTKLPHGGLDDLQLMRDSAGATELESVVRFTLIYRGA
jgi:hypothetical protein